MDTFNPHGNKTSDGKVIVVGLRVLDYDRESGTVVDDPTSETMCYGGHCRNDHWFTVMHDDGTTKNFNGTRLESITG